MNEPLVTVLLVDDHVDSLEALATSLPEALPYQLLTAMDGASALEHFLTQHIDCVITDLRMPGMDGFALIRALRTDPATSAIPFIILTAVVPLDASRFEGHLRATDQILYKPTTLTAIITAIEIALAHTPATTPVSS